MSGYPDLGMSGYPDEAVGVKDNVLARSMLALAVSMLKAKAIPHCSPQHCNDLSQHCTGSRKGSGTESPNPKLWSESTGLVYFVM